GQADLSPVDPDIEHTSFEPTRLAPHAFVLHGSDFAHSWRAGWDHDRPVVLNSSRDLHVDALAYTSLLVLRCDFLKQAQGDRRARAQNRIRSGRDGENRRSLLCNGR